MDYIFEIIWKTTSSPLFATVEASAHGLAGFRALASEMAGLTATFRKQAIRHTAPFLYHAVVEAYSLATGVITVVNARSILH